MVRFSTIHSFGVASTGYVTKTPITKAGRYETGKTCNYLDQASKEALDLSDTAGGARAGCDINNGTPKAVYKKIANDCRRSRWRIVSPIN